MSGTYCKGHYWDRVDECWRRIDDDGRIEGNPPTEEELSREFRERQVRISERQAIANLNAAHAAMRR